MAQKLLLVVLAVLFLMCESKHKQPFKAQTINYEALRKKIDSDSTNDFNPAIGTETHLAILFKIRNQKIISDIDSSAIKRRRGKMPRMRRSGTFRVILQDKAGKVLSSYYMHNPLYFRIETDSIKQLTRVVNGSFFVPFPNNRNIARVTLQEENASSKSAKILARSDITGKFDKFQ